MKDKIPSWVKGYDDLDTWSVVKSKYGKDFLIETETCWIEKKGIIKNTFFLFCDLDKKQPDDFEIKVGRVNTLSTKIEVLRSAFFKKHSYHSQYLASDIEFGSKNCPYREIKSFAIDEAKYNEKNIIDIVPPQFLLNMDNKYYSNDHFAELEDGFYIDG